MFPLTNLARKGLTLTGMASLVHKNWHDIYGINSVISWGYIIDSLLISMVHLAICLKVASLALGQS